MDVTSPLKRARGAALVEAVIALPILIVVILAAIQFGFVYQAKATLNHAALQAARAGAVQHAEPAALRRGLALGLVPLRSPEASLQGAADAVARTESELLTDARLRILNPTRESFDDFATDVDGVRELPNERLHAQSTEVGARGGLNVQDANLLRVEITYGYELKVPLVNSLLSRLSLLTAGEIDPFHEQLLRRHRLPISSTATVRMQSPLRFSELLVSRADLPDVARFAADAGFAETNNSRDNDEGSEREPQSSPGSARSGSNLSEGFFGFGSGSAEPADAASDGEETGEHADGAETPLGEQPLCTPDSGSQTTSEDQSTLGRVWDELRGLATDAYEFVRGFWEGIKDQIGDLVAAISDPIETARGIYELAMAFLEDPAGTARTIGAALGHDLSQLVDCGAYDRGRVLGSYVSPAFMLKLASKLAHFGRAGLGHAADLTKRELGCASFAADTQVWIGDRGVSIQSLQPGAWVWSRDEHSYLDSKQLVTRTFERRVSSYHEVETEASRFVVTEEHPLWVQGRGWTPVRDIEIGAPVATFDGDTLVLANRRVDAALQVFNLSVASDESYFVGDERVWAHNATCTVRVPFHPPRSPSNFTPGATDGGPGEWSPIARPDTDAYRYQQRITGAPRGVEYNVNGVNFDGYDSQRDVLLDAKHWTQECPLGDRCRSESLRQALADKLVVEARR
ncbi:MAG: TadE/TadG family type IV pilus assembly protein, partial [Steroidobacter sp.]